MKRSLQFALWMALVIAVLAGFGCAKRQVVRMDTDTVTDLSGRWNDTDSREVAQAMIGTWSTETPWLHEFVSQGGDDPAIIAGHIVNNTHEHIPTRTFLKDIERAMILSGIVDVVADRAEREQIRDERLDQLENADPETVKELGKELGADFMLTGEITDILDEEDGEEIVFYQVDLLLVDIETNRIVWPGQHKIKKYIGKGRLAP